MTRVPGVADVLSLLRAQTEALLELPTTVVALQRTVRSLGEIVTSGAETMRSVQRVAGRLEKLVDELEEPLRLLAPGLRRAAEILDDPVLNTIPDTLRRVQQEALPLLRTVSDTQARIAGIAGTTDRLMAILDEAGGRLSALPGAALLGSFTGRRTVPHPDMPARPVPPSGRQSR